jgi:hypothetical protein
LIAHPAESGRGWSEKPDMLSGMPCSSITPFERTRRSLILALAAFVVLTLSIASRSPKRLMDFDQPFYVTMAYDLDRHGVFSNGIFVM